MTETFPQSLDMSGGDEERSSRLGRRHEREKKGLIWPGIHGWGGEGVRQGQKISTVLNREKKKSFLNVDSLEVTSWRQARDWMKIRISW